MSALKGPLDRFRCVPYSATITARACVARQDAAARKAKPGRPGVPGMVGDYHECVGCPVGPLVRKAVSS